MKGTRARFRLSAEEIESLLAMARKRVPQIEIARLFGISKDTVRFHEKKAGIKRFPEMTPELENKIVATLREGTGQYAASRIHGVSFRKVTVLMKKYGISHKAGNPGLSPTLRAEIVAAVEKRENYCARLAKKFSVHPTTIQKVAHEVFGPGKLLPSWPPLCSDFPQKEVRRQIAAYIKSGGAMPALHDRVSEHTLFLLDCIIQKCFGGKMPDDQVGFAELVASWCVKQIPTETWQGIAGEQDIVKHHFALEFLAATETWRIAHEASEAVRWTN